MKLQGLPVGQRLCEQVGWAKILPPQNMLLWDMGYFILVIFKKQNTREKPLNFFLIAYQKLRGPALGREGNITDNCRLTWTSTCLIGRGEPSKTPLIKVFSVFHCDRWPSKHVVTKHMLFHLHVECLLALWSPKPQCRFISLKASFNLSLNPTVSWSPCMYVCNNFGYFLLLTCLMLIWLLDLPEEFREIKGILLFFLYNLYHLKTFVLNEYCNVSLQSAIHNMSSLRTVPDCRQLKIRVLPLSS